MNLIDIMGGEKVTVQCNDKGKYLFTTNTESVFISAMEEIVDYPHEAINNFLKVELPYSVILGRKEILGVLDRLDLFSSAYDAPWVKVEVSDKSIVFSNDNGIEEIEFEDGETATPDNPIVFKVDIQMVIDQLTARGDDSITLWFGIDNAIKITGGDVTNVIALIK
jgi:hypothetical protein